MLKDPRTDTFNFDSHLHQITQPEDFNFDHVPVFVPASLDKSLHQLAASRSAKYVSSTSSISPTMSLLYFLLSKGRLLNLRHLSMDFSDELRTFTALSRSPLAVVVRPHGDSVRSILIEKLDAESILSKLGHTLERFLTEHPDDFNKMLLKNQKDQLRGGIMAEEEEEGDDGKGFFHYTQCGDMLLRSQIDCMDRRLPRMTFDIKTRATFPIRMDLYNYSQYLDYRLDKQHGLVGSFERELYDMSRSAFLKYNLQARIGGMDGIFVAYHNTVELFGFQYLSREWIDECIFGSQVAGDLAFKLLLSSYSRILEIVLSKVNKDWTARMTWVLSKDYSRLNLFVESFEDYPTQRNTIMAPADKFEQYTLTSSMRVNGIRVDAFPGIEGSEPLAGAKLQATLTLSQVDNPSRQEFDQARSKCGESRVSAEDMSCLSSGVMEALGKHRSGNNK